MAKEYTITVSETRTKNIIVSIDDDKFADKAVNLATKLANNGFINMDDATEHRFDAKLVSRASKMDIIALPCYDKNGRFA